MQSIEDLNWETYLKIFTDKCEEEEFSSNFAAKDNIDWIVILKNEKKIEKGKDDI